MSDENFAQWALVELFGHKRVAGRVTEQEVGGCNFVRVDVPNENGDGWQHTSLYGQGAIYAINFVTEAFARAMAKRLEVAPVYSYEMPAISYEGDPYDEGPF